MRKTTVGVLVGVLVIVAMCLSASPALAACPDACEMFWTPPVNYTDGTPIETQDLPLSFVIKYDGSDLAATTNVSLPVPKPYGHGVAHSISIKTITARGSEGAFSPPFGWSSPVGIPGDASGIGVR